MIAGAAFLFPVSNATEYTTPAFPLMQYGPVRKQSLADLCNENLPK